jgi:hypothetical protein
MAVQTKILHRRDTAANWTSTNPTLSAGEIGFETDTLKFKIGNGSTAWTSLTYSQDASLLSGAASITSLTTSGNVIVGGDLTVNGTTTSINSSTVQVDDKNIELASVTAVTGRVGTAVSGVPSITISTAGLIVGMTVTRTAGVAMTTGTISSIGTGSITVTNAPSASGSITLDFGGATDTTADGAGLTVLGATNKTFIYDNSTTSWLSNQDLGVATGKVFEINGSTVLSATQVLGYAIATANTVSTVVARDASGNFSAGTITASLTGTASLASNLTGGNANKGAIVYQSGVNTTSQLTATTTNNQVLSYDTSTNAPYWTAVTGTGSVVLAANAVMTTPNIGVPSFATLTNATGYKVDNLSNTGTSVIGALQVAVGTAGAFVVNGGALGTPSSANLSSATGLPVATGISGLGTNVATFLATPSSANFLNTVTGATGNGGGVVFANNATLVAPSLGVATGTSINVTGQLISTVATGTAPLSVASTTRVTNLNAATAGVADSATIAGQANNITATANNIVYVGATANTTSTLAYSTANNGAYLGISSGQPAWVTPSPSGVTNVATGAGLTGGPITSTGTVSLNTAYATTWSTTQRINVSTDVLTLGIRANTTQTANIFEARDGAATMMMSLSNVGTLFAVTIDGGTA